MKVVLISFAFLLSYFSLLAQDTLSGRFNITSIDRSPILGNYYWVIGEKLGKSYKIFIDKRVKCTDTMNVIKLNQSYDLSIRINDLMLTDSMSIHSCYSGLYFILSDIDSVTGKSKEKKVKEVLKSGETPYESKCLCVSGTTIFKKRD
jgi:hypothetical protein